MGVLGLTAFLLFSFKDTLAARSYFNDTRFPVVSVEKQAGTVRVTQEIPPHYVGEDPTLYRECPYSTDPVWSYQKNDVIQVEYLAAGVVVAKTECPKDWSLKKEVAAVLKG